jgi:hypothetical protein
MDEIERLRRYAAHSARQSPLAIDVRARVLESIRRRRPDSDWLAGSVRPMVFAAAASLLVAASLGLLAQHSLAEMQDPLASFFTPFLVTFS